MPTTAETESGAAGQLLWGWRYLSSLMAVSVALGVLFVALPAVVAAVADALKFTPGQAGWVGSASLWGLVAGSLLAVPLSVRMPVRAAVLPLTLACGVLEACCALVTSPGGLAALQALVGVAAGCSLGVMSATMARSKNPDAAVSFLLVAQLAIGALVLVVLPPVMSGAGIRGGWLFIAGVMAASFVVAALTLPSIDKPPEPASASGQGGWSTFARTPVILGLLSVALFYIAQTTIYTYYGVLGMQNAGMSYGAVNTALGIAVIAGIAGAMLGGWVGDRIGRIFPVCVMTAGLVIAMLLLYGTPGPARFWASALLFQFAMSYAIVPWLAFMAGLDPMGRVMAAASFVLNFGFAAGASVASRIVSANTNQSGIVDFVPVLTAALGLFAVSCIVFVVAVLAARVRANSSAVGDM